MKVRKGFVSNSSSCSYILVLPRDGRELKKEEYREYFSFSEFENELTDVVSEVIQENDRQTVDRIISSCRDDLEYMEDCLKSESFRSLWKYYETESRKQRRILELYREDPARLVTFEVGDSNTYKDNPESLTNGILKEILSSSKGENLFHKNAFMINNR